MLNNIVENIVNRKLLTEITCIDAYQRFYKDIDEQTYKEIVQKTQGNNNILLPDTKWVLACYKRDPEYAKTALDTVRLRDDRKTGVLDLFDRLKVRGEISGTEADLNRFTSIQQLCDFISDFNIHEILKRTQGEWSRAIKNAKDEIKVFYEDENWYVVIPETMEASCYWGSGTEWCTITRDENENYFHSYDDDGPLFILIHKKHKGEKYQFHFESNSFMDREDEPIQQPVLKSIAASNGLISAFRNYCDEMGYDFIDLIYNVIGNEYNGFTCIEINDSEYNFINEYNEIAFPEYVFYRPAEFKYEWIIADGADILRGDEFRDFMNYNGEFRFNKELDFEEIGTPSHGIVFIRTENGVNYFDLSSGELISENWFADGTDFTITRSVTYSSAVVKNENGKKNILKAIDGELISDDWFDSIKPLLDYSIYFIVETTDDDENSLYNIMDFQGKYLLPQWCYFITDAGVATGEVVACKTTPLTDKNIGILFFDISTGKIIDDNIEKWDGHFKQKWGLGGVPTWTVMKNGKYNFLTVFHGYRLPEWADSVRYVQIPLPKDGSEISEEMWKARARGTLMPILKYGDKEYYPTCKDWRDEVKLVEYIPEVNENKFSKKDLMYIIHETLNKLK